MLLLTAVARAETAAPQCPARSLQKTSPFEVGLHIQTILPGQLPDFVSSLPVYGPILGIPFFGDNLQLQAFYGTLSDFWIYTFEANYRFNVATPFFTGFAQAGAHYMNYKRLANGHSYAGPNFATGVSFDMADNFDMNLLLKVYLQEHPLFSFGGGFALLF